MNSIAATFGSFSPAQSVPGKGLVQRTVHAAVRAMSRRRTERALAGLSDHALKDIGIRRGEIDSIAAFLAGGRFDATRIPRPRHNHAWL